MTKKANTLKHYKIQEKRELEKLHNWRAAIAERIIGKPCRLDGEPAIVARVSKNYGKISSAAKSIKLKWENIGRMIAMGGDFKS